MSDMSDSFKLTNIISKYKGIFENKNDMFAFILELHKNVQFNSTLSYTELYKDISDVYKDPTPAYNGDKYTPENIEPNDMSDTDIFVFGSNTEGKHGGGAAKFAHTHFGAVYGQAEGLQGQSYAIVTKDLNIGNKSVDIEYIEDQINMLINFAIDNKDKTFWMTKIGCGLGGFDISDIAPLFMNKVIPENIILPIEFVLPQYHMEYLYSNKSKTFYHLQHDKNKMTMVTTKPNQVKSIDIDFTNVNIFNYINYDVVSATKDEYEFALEYVLKKML